jgi:hypothetical protein
MTKASRINHLRRFFPSAGAGTGLAKEMRGALQA